MPSYDYRSIVSRNEVEALREVIFNRARQRAEAMANQVQTEYKNSFREEMMDIARNSFNAPGNPFGNKINALKEEPVQQAQKTEQIGFEQHTSEEKIQEIIKSRSESSDKVLSQNEVYSVMNSAGTEFEKSKGFMGALDFLNSQASLSLMSSRKPNFEMIA